MYKGNLTSLRELFLQSREQSVAREKLLLKASVLNHSQLCSPSSKYLLQWKAFCKKGGGCIHLLKNEQVQLWRKHDCTIWGLDLVLDSALNMLGEQGQISGFLCASISLLDTGSDERAAFFLPGVFWSVQAAGSLVMSVYPAQHSISQVCCGSFNQNSNTTSPVVLWFLTILSGYMTAVKVRWVLNFSFPCSCAVVGVPSQTDHAGIQCILPHLQIWVTVRGRTGSLPGHVFPGLTGFLFGGRDRQLPPALIVLTWKHRNHCPGSERRAVSPNILPLTVASSRSSGKCKSIRAVQRYPSPAVSTQL